MESSKDRDFTCTFRAFWFVARRRVPKSGRVPLPPTHHPTPKSENPGQLKLMGQNAFCQMLSSSGKMQLGHFGGLGWDGWVRGWVGGPERVGGSRPGAFWGARFFLRVSRLAPEGAFLGTFFPHLFCMFLGTWLFRLPRCSLPFSSGFWFFPRVQGTFFSRFFCLRFP